MAEKTALNRFIRRYTAQKMASVEAVNQKSRGGHSGRTGGTDIQ
jgi:hypothetical protein